jgi:hypothetical protein
MSTSTEACTAVSAWRYTTWRRGLVVTQRFVEFVFSSKCLFAKTRANIYANNARIITVNRKPITLFMEW